MGRKWWALCRAPAFWGWGLGIVWKALLAPFVIDTTVGALFSTGALVITALMWDRWNLGRFRGVLLNLIGVAGVAGTVIVAAGSLGLGISHESLVLAASVANACVALFLVLSWSAVFSRIPMMSVSFMLSISYVAAAAVYSALQLFSVEAQQGVSVVLVPLCVACIKLCGQRLDAEALFGSSLPVKSRVVGECSHSLGDLLRAYPWRLVAVFAFFSFAVGINRVHSTVSVDMASAGIAGIVLMLCVVASLVRVNAFQLYKAAIPVMLACLLVGVLTGSGTLLAQVAINVSYAFAQMLLVLLLCDKSYRFDVPIVFLYGIGRACLSAALVAGSLVGQALAVWFAREPFLETNVIYGILLLGAFLAIAFWITGNDYLTAFSPGAPAECIADEDVVAKQVETCSQVDPPADRAQLLQGIIEERCGVLAREYRLSKRESEVLVLLGWGKSARRIEEVLVLSPNTVKTHVRHIYAKLGIHSRSELDALLDASGMTYMEN